MIVSPNYVAYDEAKGCKYRAGMRIRDKRIEFRFKDDGKPLFTGSHDVWAPIELDMTDTLVCRAHDNSLISKDMTGLYYCEHLAALRLDSAADAEFFKMLVGFLTKDTSRTFVLNLQIFEDVFRQVNFTLRDSNLTFWVKGYNPWPIGVVTPKYEGLSVVRQMVVEHYEMWTLASRTMCTGSSHWKSKTAEFTVKDRLVLDVEKMCYPCVRRSADAMLATQHPENEVGFDSLPKSTPPKSSPGASPWTPTGMRPTYSTPSSDEPLSPFAGGPSTTSGSVRVNPKTGMAEVYDGKGNWILRGTLVPDNVSLFHSTVDEREWNNFIEYRDGVPF